MSSWHTTQSTLQHTHVQQADTVRQQPGDISQRTSTVIDWRFAIYVSKSTTIVLARARLHFCQPRPVTLFGERTQRVDTALYFGATLDTRLTWSPHLDHVRNRNAHSMGMLASLLSRKSDLSVRKSPAIKTAHPPHDGLCKSRMEVRYQHPRRDAAGIAIQGYAPSCGCPWHEGSSRIHENTGCSVLCLPQQSLNSDLAGVGKPSCCKLGRYLR